MPFSSSELEDGLSPRRLTEINGIIKHATHTRKEEGKHVTNRDGAAAVAAAVVAAAPAPGKPQEAGRGATAYRCSAGAQRLLRSDTTADALLTPVCRIRFPTVKVEIRGK